MNGRSPSKTPPNGYPILHTPQRQISSSTTLSERSKEQEDGWESDTLSLFHQSQQEKEEDDSSDNETDVMNCQPFYCLSFSEGQLLLLLIIAMFAIGVLVALLVIMKTETPVCATARCVHEAALHLSHMNISEDPCNKFYQFACRNAKTENKWKNIWKTPTLQLSSQRILQRVRRLFLDDERSIRIADKPSSAVSLTREFFQSCTNLENRYEVGKSSLVDMVDRLGGWSLVGRGRNSSIEQVTYLQAQALRYGSKPFIKVSVEINPFNTKTYAIQLSSPSTIIPQEVLRGNRETHRMAFRDYFVGIANSLKTNNITVTSLQVMADEIWLLERKLIFLMDKDEKESGLKALNQVTKSSVAEITEQTKENFNFRRLLEIIYNITNIPDTETIVLESVNLLGLINAELRKWDYSVKESYIIAQILHRTSVIHGFHLQSLKYRFKTMIGATPFKDLGDQCMLLTDRLFPSVINAIYASTFISRSSILESTFLANRMKRASQSYIKRNKWMDEVTRKEALLKLERITVSVARPLTTTGVKEMDDYFSPLKDKLSGENIYLNYMTMREFQVSKERAIMMETANVVNYVRTLAKADAVFIQPLLHLEVRSRLLQYPFFHEDFAEAFNYGGLGTLLANELSDSFHEDGRFMDSDGKLRDWWSSSTLQNFMKTQQCFIDNYNMNDSLTSSTVTVPLQQQLGDSLGLHIAYEAFSHYHLAKSMAAVRLPGMKTVTMDQLFFITVAQKHCAYYAKRHAGESYAEAEKRVLIAMSNLPAFATAFQCRPGDRYNPPNRCAV